MVRVPCVDQRCRTQLQGAGSKKQYDDQKLKRGNLALQGNMKLKIPVRVIRKCPDRSR